MPVTVVVPLLEPNIDYAGISERALPYARMLADQPGARVVLVSAIDVMTGTRELRGMSPEFASERERWIEGWASERRAYLETIAQTFPRGRAEIMVLEGDIKSGVIELVKTLDNPVVVMGSHARTGSARMMYGSVTFDIIHDIDAPVLAVRRRLPEPAGAQLRKILVPLDGSAFAEQVIPATLNVLAGERAEFYLVHVIDLARTPPDDESRAEGRTPYQWAKAYLPGVARDLEARGHRVSWNILDGSIAEEISDAAHEEGCDLIAMATNSRGGLSRLVYGSVAETVLHDSGLPLLLIRPE